MSQLIVLADDIAISHATTLGILDGIHRGIVRNTGIFTNRPDTEFAANALKDIPGIDVGIDLNFVTGSPVLAADRVPALVTEHGAFRSSHELKATHREVSRDGLYADYDPEPFDHDQLLAEARAQVERFLHLFGRTPAYVHHHSFVSTMSDQVLHEVAEEYGLFIIDDAFRFGQVPLLPNEWYTSPFGADVQAAADPIAAFLPHLPQIRDNAVTALITHPGYVDAELIDSSSYHVIRARDLALVTDPGVQQLLAEAGVEVARASDVDWNRVR